MLLWKKTKCSGCSGYGLVSDYSGGDFNGPKECNDCDGAGVLAVSPKDRLALWPGGPFAGVYPGLYNQLTELWP